MVCIATGIKLHPLTSKPHLHSGTLIPLLEAYPQAGLTLMIVRSQLFRFSSIVLICVSALPTVEHFAQNGAICVGGDAAAWFAKFGPDPVTRIVSLKISIPLFI